VSNKSVQRFKSIHILIIDDNPQEIENLLAVLKQQGARITVANEPRKGIQLAQVFYPDLILLDVHMPSIDGFAVCRLLLEMPACQDIPVIFLTSAVDVADRVNGLTLGGVDYILKPFEVDEVVARITVHLQLVKRRNAPSNEIGLSPLNLHPDQVILQAALRLIARQLSDLPKLSEIAEQVGTYDKKLSTIFREHLGMTVFAWVREERLRKAQELLARSHMTIENISAEVGFTSAANFATAFRERFLVTPTGYRDAFSDANEVF
jgi:DNA-binding response OmpR family regulator